MLTRAADSPVLMQTADCRLTASSTCCGATQRAAGAAVREALGCRQNIAAVGHCPRHLWGHS